MSKKRLAALTWGHFCVDFYTNILTSALPFLVLSMKLSMTSAGLLVTFARIIASVLQPAFGYMADRIGIAVMIPFSLLWTVLFLSTTGWFSEYFLILLTATVGSAGAALYHPLGSMAVAALYPHRKNEAISIFITGGSLGFSLAPLIVIPLAQWLGLKGLTILAIPGIIGTILLVRWGYNDGKPIQRPVEKPVNKEGGISWKSLTLLNIISGIRGWIQLSIGTFLPLLYISWGYSKVTAGGLITVFLITGTFGCLLGGLAERFKSRQIFVTVTFVLSALFLVLFLYWPIGVAGWIFIGLTGIFISASTPATMVVAQEILPDYAGMAYGMILGLSYGIGSLGVMITGVVGDFFGLNFALGLNVLLSLLAALAAWRLPGGEKPNTEIQGKIKKGVFSYD